VTHQNIPYLDKTGRTIFDGLIHSESDNLQTRLRAYVADIIFDFESKLQRTEVSSFEQMAEIFVRCLVEHKLFSLSWTEYIQPDGKKRMVAVDWQTSRVENLLNTFGLYRKNGFKKHYMFLMNILFSGSDPYYDHLREMVRKKGFYVQEVNNFFNRKLLFLQRTNQLEIHHSKLAMSFYNGGIQFFKNREKIDHFCYFPVLDYSRSNPIIGITTGLYRRPQSLEKMESLLKGMPGNQLLTDDQKYLVFRQLGSKIIFPILNHYFEIFWNRHLNQQITVRGSIEQYPHPLLVYNEKGICVDGNGKAFKALGHEQSAHQILNFSFDQQKNDDTVSFEILKQKIKDYYQTQSPKNSESFETTVHFKTKNGKSVKMLVRANINRINQKINSGLFYSFYLENIKEQALTHHYHQIVEENFFRVETPGNRLTPSDYPD
jgi:PAS domain-containing protein